MDHLPRSPPNGILRRSFAPKRETIAATCSIGDALATVPIAQTGS